MEFKLALIEDEEKMRTIIVKILNQAVDEEQSLQIDVYKDAESFLSSEKNYDVLVSDIELPGKSGMELGRILKKENRKLWLVFLTAYAEFAADSYVLDAYQYILKRDMKERLPIILNQLINEKRQAEKEFLWIGNVTDQKKIYYRDIVYIVKLKGQKYTEFVTKKNVYKERISLWQVEEQINHPAFVSVGRSWIININHIARIRSDEIYLENGEIIRVSRDQIQEVKKKITKYWRNIK